jgi:hypothetical protein
MEAAPYKRSLSFAALKGADKLHTVPQNKCLRLLQQTRIIVRADASKAVTIYCGAFRIFRSCQGRKDCPRYGGASLTVAPTFVMVRPG